MNIQQLKRETSQVLKDFESGCLSPKKTLILLTKLRNERFKECDRIREYIHQHGFQITDTQAGYRINRI